MKKQFVIKSQEELPCVAKEFLTLIGSSKLIAFYGVMGVGKTTFIKSLCNVLGVEDVVNSPTFSIVNEYDYDNKKVFHFDFYRIKKVEEAFDFGIEDYFYSGNYCFMEWPELVEEILPDDVLKVFFTELPDGKRIISFEKEILN